MGTLYVKINKDALLKKAQELANKKAKPYAEKAALKIFNNAKIKMLNEFENHPVTRELEDPDSSNISNTLDSIQGDKPNLFGFLGFQAGTNPIEPLRELLEEEIDIRYTSFRNNTYYFRIDLPKKEEIERITPMEWENGNSWAYAIEQNISNLSHFLSKMDVGRSELGIQVKGEVDDVYFQPIQYLSEIFENFQNNIKEKNS